MNKDLFIKTLSENIEDLNNCLRGLSPPEVFMPDSELSLHEISREYFKILAGKLKHTIFILDTLESIDGFNSMIDQIDEELDEIERELESIIKGEEN